MPTAAAGVPQSTEESEENPDYAGHAIRPEDFTFQFHDPAASIPSEQDKGLEEGDGDEPISEILSVILTGTSENERSHAI